MSTNNINLYLFDDTKYEFIVYFVQFVHNTIQNNISHDATSNITTICHRKHVFGDAIPQRWLHNLV